MRWRIGTFLFLIATSVLAQAPPPFTIVDAAHTVRMEHEDRMRRLSVLAGLQSQHAPVFLDYSIPQSLHQLKAFPVALPVLRVIFGEQAFFDSNRDRLTSAAYAVLNVIAASLQQEPPDVTIFVVGHTDALGTADHNLDLGLRRAEAVSTALVRLGVNRTQMYQVSFGEAVPIASNHDQAGRARNRRVEFLFSARPEPIAAWLAMQPSHLCDTRLHQKNSDCPTGLLFHAESVKLRQSDTPPRKRQAPRAISKPDDEAVPEPTNTGLDIGRTKIDINLAQKLFTIRVSK